MTISAYSGTAGSNTAINGINIAEGCAPGNINDAIRNLMADIANGPIATAAGSAAAASYSFGSFPGTGMYRGGADVLSFATGGVRRAEIISTGAFNLFGPQSIQSGLPATNPALFVSSDSANSGRIRVGNNVDFVGGDDALGWSINYGGVSNNGLTWTNAAGLRIQTGSTNGGKLRLGNNVDFVGGDDNLGWSINYGGGTNNGLTWTNAVGLRIQANSTNGGVIRLGNNIDLKGGDDFTPNVFRVAVNATDVVKVTGAGNVEINGTLTQLSDRRLKTDIVPLEGALAAILALQGVRYTRVIDSTHHIGLIAQDLEAVRPEYVHTGEGGFKSVAYGNIVTDLIEAVKTLAARVAALEAG